MAAAACPTPELLSRYQLGQLPAADAEQIAGHLKDCSRCLDLMAQHEKQGDGMLQRLRRVPSFETDSDVYRQALAKVLAEPLMETKEQRPPTGLETPASTRGKHVPSSKRLPRPAEVVQLAAAMPEPALPLRRGLPWGWLFAVGLACAFLVPLLLFWSPLASTVAVVGAPQDPPLLTEATGGTAQKEWAIRLGRPLQRQNSQQIDLVLLPAGSWQSVAGVRCSLSRPFEIAVYEITRRQFRAFLSETEPKSPRLTVPAPEGHTAEHPIVGISWEEAAGYCRWLSLKEKTIYRLPTEVEWQMAAGLHLGQRLPVEAMNEQAWFVGNSGGRLRSVGQRRPNAWGLHDMLGNAAEWCHDGFGPLPSVPLKDYRGLEDSTLRSVRGGGFHLEAEKQAQREGLLSTATAPHVGFRVVCEVPQAGNATTHSERTAAPSARLDLSTLSARRYP